MIPSSTLRNAGNATTSLTAKTHPTIIKPWINSTNLANAVIEEADARLKRLKRGGKGKTCVTTVRVDVSSSPSTPHLPVVSSSANSVFATTTTAANKASPPKYLMAENHAKRLARRLGIEFRTKILPSDARENEFIAAVTALNYDDDVTGILCHRPLPSHYSTKRVHEALNPAKDVEGMHPISLGRVVYGTPILYPCTARAAVALCASVVPLRGLDALVIGVSDVLAKPICSLLQMEGSTVTVCRHDTTRLPVYARSCQAVFSSTTALDEDEDDDESEKTKRYRSKRQPFRLMGDMIRPDSMLIDVGYHVDEATGAVTGDADLESCIPVVSEYATIQYGVGLLKTAYMFLNVAIAAEIQQRG